MLAHSPSKDRSRSPHRTNGQTKTSSSSSPPPPPSSNINDTSSLDETNSKSKKENDSQVQMKSLKTFIQTLIHDPSSLGSNYDEQIQTLETACSKEFRDLSIERIRRMIRSVYKSRKHQDQTNNSDSKKNRSNSTSTKSSDLLSTSALPGFDADFLRHAFSQQFRPSIDLSAYFSAASNNSPSTSSLFRPDFSPTNFLQSLTAPPPPLVSSHSHTNGSYPRNSDTSSSLNNSTKLSKQMKLSTNEVNSIKVLVNAYREAASYLNRSADELEQLV